MGQIGSIMEQRPARPRSSRACTLPWLFAVAGAVVTPSCSSPTSARPSQGPAVATVEVAGAASVASAPHALPHAAPVLDAGPLAPPEEQPPAKREPVSDPKAFACGSRTCLVGQETCCAYEGEGHCLKSSPDDGPKGAIGYLQTQWAACDKETFAKSSRFNRLARCDESLDCSGQQVCCLDFLYSGSDGLADCMPLRRDGRTPCDFGEQCIPGSPCRLPGTVCEEGHCVKPVPNFPCGAAPCGRGEVCCGGNRGCEPAEGCPYHERMQCRSAKDCLPGQMCIYDAGNTICTAGYPEGGVGIPVVCKSDSECKSSCDTMGGGHERCVESDVSWLKRCQCPGP